VVVTAAVVAAKAVTVALALAVRASLTRADGL
jgi:hypothetical protein